MKKPKHKKISRLLLFSIIINFTLYACSDDNWVKDPDNKIVVSGRNKELSVEAAEEWYNSNKQPIMELRSSSDQDAILTKPEWKNAKESKKGKFEVVETPLKTNKAAVFLDAKTKKQKTKNDNKFIRNTAKMVVMKNLETKEIDHFIMIFVGSYDYLKNTKTIGKNTYLKKEKDFDGNLLFFSTDYGFINGWRYENGKITGRISPTYESFDIPIQTRVQVCDTESYFVELENCWEVGYEDAEMGFIGMGEQCEPAGGYWVNYEVCYWESDPDYNDNNDYEDNSDNSSDSNNYTPNPGEINTDIVSLLKEFEKLRKFNDVYKALTPKEVSFIKTYSVVAVSFLRNAQRAELASNAAHPGLGPVDTMRDAHRHALWCALNAYDWGKDLAKLYGDAHEDYNCQASNSCSGREMDLYNNNIGYTIGLQVRNEGGTRFDIEYRIKEMAYRGVLKKLKD